MMCVYELIDLIKHCMSLFIMNIFCYTDMCLFPCCVEMFESIYQWWNLQLLLLLFVNSVGKTLCLTSHIEEERFNKSLCWICHSSQTCWFHVDKFGDYTVSTSYTSLSWFFIPKSWWNPKTHRSPFGLFSAMKLCSY